MTPKEKASELVNKMYHYQWREKERAKQCALIAVELLIKELEECSIYSMYWQQVKQEIEKL